MTAPRDSCRGVRCAGRAAPCGPARGTSPNGLASGATGAGGLAHRGLGGLAQEVVVAVWHADVSQRGLVAPRRRRICLARCALVASICKSLTRSFARACEV